MTIDNLEKPTPKLRLLHFMVQPILLTDDGEQLSPGPAVQAQALTLLGLKDLVETWPQKLAQIEAEAAKAFG